MRTQIVLLRAGEEGLGALTRRIDALAAVATSEDAMDAGPTRVCSPLHARSAGAGH